MKENYVIGIDLGGTNIKFGLANEKGKITKKIVLPAKTEKGPESVISQILKGINLLLDKSEVNIKGIGIGAPGTVISEKGTVENPPNFPGWEKVPLGKIISKNTNISVQVENDANAAAIGELIYGTGKKLDDFLMVTLGTGVGGGIVINKKLYRGSHGAAGEIGHVSIDHNGRKCKCGSKGCVETYIGNNYLIKNVRRNLYKHGDSLITKMIKKDKSLLSPKLISEAAEQHDDYAISIIVEAGRSLGYGIASVINAIDITNVIIGGGVAGFGEILFRSIETTIQQRVMKPFRDKIHIFPAKLKNEAGIKGAAALVFYKS